VSAYGCSRERELATTLLKTTTSAVYRTDKVPGEARCACFLPIPLFVPARLVGAAAEALLGMRISCVCEGCAPIIDGGRQTSGQSRNCMREGRCCSPHTRNFHAQAMDLLRFEYEDLCQEIVHHTGIVEKQRKGSCRGEECRDDLSESTGMSLGNRRACPVLSGPSTPLTPM
jgi:hypothetical protein